MSHPSHSPYPSGHPYATSGGPQRPRRNTALIGGIVIACTTLVLGSILLVTFVANRDDGEPAAEEGEGTERPAEEAAEETADNDPEAVAVMIVEIMFGMSDRSSEVLVCSDPGAYLVDLDATGEAAGEMFAQGGGVIDEFVASDTTETDEGASVEVSMVVSGFEQEVGTVDLVIEDGSWKACNFTF